MQLVVKDSYNHTVKTDVPFPVVLSVRPTTPGLNVTALLNGITTANAQAGVATFFGTGLEGVFNTKYTLTFTSFDFEPIEANTTILPCKPGQEPVGNTECIIC